MFNRLLTICTFALLASLAYGAPSAPAGVAVAAAQQISPPAVGGSALLAEILQLSNAYFNRFPFMRAEDVYAKIVQGGDSSYLLVSVQSPEEYARGHVPGAVNIPLAKITTAEALAQFPRNKKIVFTCDNGHRSMAAALFLGQLGYETYAMSMGLSYWNGAEAGIDAPFPGSAGYPVSNSPAPQPPAATLPVIADTATTGREVIINRTKAVLAGSRSLFIDREEVYAKAVKDGDPGYLLVSLQRPTDYAKGHVPGAINIPVNDLAKAEILRQLPKDKKIVLICYVGHWAGSGAMFLSQLGYEAYDMRFGTLGWNDTTDGLGEAKGYLVTLEKSSNLPVEKGVR